MKSVLPQVILIGLMEADCRSFSASSRPNYSSRWTRLTFTAAENTTLKRLCACQERHCQSHPAACAGLPTYPSGQRCCPRSSANWAWICRCRPCPTACSACQWRPGIYGWFQTCSPQNTKQVIISNVHKSHTSEEKKKNTKKHHF